MDRALKSYLNGIKYESYIGYQKEAKGKVNRRVLQLFHKASETIPAYKDFLSKHKIKHKKIRSIGDYKKIPITTKDNYIQRYDLKDRCWNGDVYKVHTFASSSGSTGKPLFWPRNIVQEVDGAQIHEYLLKKVYEVQKHKTLFINSFGLGNWIAGIYTEMCLYLLRLRGLPFTLASPGYNQEETFKVVKGFSHYYDQTIIACHPPILKIMIENGVNEGIKWKKLNVKFFGAGEGFTENWRDYLLSLVGQKDPFRSIVNIYGSADAGLMGFETPLSIALHRETAFNHQLNQLIFNNERNPYLYQFDPLKKYIESFNGEIVITMDSAMPLLRYNIQDNGSVIESDHLLDIVRKNSPQFSDVLHKNKIILKEWEFPFVYLFGRDRFMTTLYGVNIYPENVKTVFEHKNLQKFLTGRFLVEKNISDKQNPYMVLRVELRKNVSKNNISEIKIKKLFVQTLKKLNSEYDQVEIKFKEKMHPKILFYKFNDPEFFPEGLTKKMA